MKSSLLVLLLWLISVPAWAGSKEDATRYYEDALESFNAKDYAAAEIYLKNVLNLSPNHLPSRILLSKSHLEQGEGAAAEKEIRLARRLGADPDLILLPLAKALAQQRKYGDLIAMVDARGLAPSLRAEVLFYRGTAYLELRDYAGARAAFDQALHSRPDLVLPTVGLAMLELRQNRLEAAASLLDKASRLDPANAEVWHAMGALAYAPGDLPAAISHYSQALALQPTHFTARISRATANLDAGNHADAASELHELSEHARWDPQVAYFYGLALERSGDDEGAREALGHASAIIDAAPYERLREHLPTLLLAGLIKHKHGELERAQRFFSDYLVYDKNSVVALKLLGSTLLAMNEPVEAVQVLKRAEEKAPWDTSIQILLGNAYMDSGHHALAVKSFKKAEALAPGNPDVLAKLGIAHLATGERKAAIRELEAALRKQPEAVKTAMMLISAHLGSGNPERARTIAENLVNRQPGNATAMNLLASTYVHLEKPELARQWLKKSLEADPNFRPARINLASLDRREGRIEQSRQALEPLLQADPDNLTLLVELSRLENSQGNTDRARQLLEKAYSLDSRAILSSLELIALYLEQDNTAAALDVAQNLHKENPETPEVLEALGRAQLAVGNRAEAQVAFSRAGNLSGYDSVRLYRIALWQLRADAVDDARWSLQKATEGDPHFLPARLALVELQIRTGRLKNASRLIDELVESHPAHPDVSTVRGDLAMAEGDYVSAIAAYQKALKMVNSSDAAIRLFRAQSASDEHTQALRDLTEWTQKHPRALAAKRLLAEIHHAAGRLEQARTQYEEILEHKGDDADLLNNLSNVYAELGDPRALDLAVRAHAIQPGDAGIIDTLGWLLVQSGQAEKGLGYLRDASARNSNSPEIRYHLAVALAALNRNEEAKQEVQRALSSGQSFDGMAEAKRLFARLSQ